MRYLRRTRRSLWGKISLVVLICLIVYLSNSMNSSKDNCEDLISRNVSQLNLIFNIEEWRGRLINAESSSSDAKDLWCDVPFELRKVSNALCQMYIRKDCKRLPCYLIYSSSKTLKEIECSKNEERKRFDSNLNESNLLCKSGYSLDLFCNQSSFPSIILDSLTKHSNQFYLNELNEKLRRSNSIWGLRFNFESVSNYPWNKDLNYLNLFDIKFGYDRTIYDFILKPWLFDYIDQIQFKSKRLTIEQIISMKKVIDSPNDQNDYWINQEKNCSKINSEFNCSSVRSPILWMNSNCRTLSKRSEYLEELSKYIPIDNYGNCGKNILPLPEQIVQIQKSFNQNLKNRGSYLWEKGKLALSSNYLFTIAFENSFDHDYITEKLWHSFIAGSIPIYYGAPNIQDWLPCQTNCIIDLQTFQTPEQAAIHIENIARNRTLYLTYHQWRNEPLTNKFQKMIDYFEKTNKVSLECSLCYLSDQVKRGYNKKQTLNQLKQSFQIF